mgnify:CR=1 FL=1
MYLTRSTPYFVLFLAARRSPSSLNTGIDKSLFSIEGPVQTPLHSCADELSPAKERCLNQFGTTVLIRCGNVVKFDKVCRIVRHWSGK